MAASHGKSGLLAISYPELTLVKNFERTLDNATAKVNLCFIRLMLKRLALN